MTAATTGRRTFTHHEAGRKTEKYGIKNGGFLMLKPPFYIFFLKLFTKPHFFGIIVVIMQYRGDNDV